MSQEKLYKPDNNPCDSRLKIESLSCENKPKTFESLLVPKSERMLCWIANQITDQARYPEKFNLAKPTEVPSFSKRLAFLNFMLPGRCNATCPQYCFTSAPEFRLTPDSMTKDQAITVVREFKSMGGNVVRILGTGEPLIQPYLYPLLHSIRENELKAVIFTNGLVETPQFKSLFAGWSGLYVYIKLWTENAEMQSTMVGKRYVYEDGEYGLAPRLFYDLCRLSNSKSRVGFETMVSQENLEETARMIKGRKKELPWFIEPFLPMGLGSTLHHLTVREEAMREKAIPVTIECNNPPRASYMATVDEKFHLRPEVFVKQDSIPLAKSSLLSAWNSAIERDAFFQARYGNKSGCFCLNYIKSTK